MVLSRCSVSLRFHLACGVPFYWFFYCLVFSYVIDLFELVMQVGAASMLVLFETPAGFALFKVLDEGKLDKGEVWMGVFGVPNCRCRFSLVECVDIHALS